MQGYPCPEEALQPKEHLGDVQPLGPHPPSLSYSDLVCRVSPASCWLGHPLPGPESAPAASTWAQAFLLSLLGAAQGPSTSAFLLGSPIGFMGANQTPLGTDTGASCVHLKGPGGGRSPAPWLGLSTWCPHLVPASLTGFAACPLKSPTPGHLQRCWAFRTPFPDCNHLSIS